MSIWRSLLRLAFSLLLSWLFLVALWLGLPSPSVDTDPNYSTTVLKAGKSLTRVYDTNDFFPYFDDSISVQQSRRTGRLSFVLEYALNIPSQSLHLASTTSLNVTPPAILPSLSLPFVVSAKTGDQDGVFPPWFSHADATLLFGQSGIYTQDIAPLSIRAKWTETGRLELWPDSQYWVEGSSNPPGLSPLLSFENYTPATQAQFRAELPIDKSSFSPSYTYPVRILILKVLKPTVLAARSFLGLLESIGAGLWTLFGLIAQCVVFYIAVVAVVWCARGRPPFPEFFATSPLTRFVHARLVPDQDHRSSTRELEKFKDKPQPLSSVWAFFSSSSPLDDLLVMFEVTSWMTQPLGRRNSSMVSESSNTMRETGDNDLEAGFGLAKG